MEFKSYRVLLFGFLFALLVGLAAGSAGARPPDHHGSPGGGHHGPPGQTPPTTGSVSASGTLPAINTAAGTFTVTDRNGFSAVFKTNSATVITLDGKTAALAALAVNDPVQVTYDRTSFLASRVVATSPPPVDLTGTITALNAGTLP